MGKTNAPGIITSVDKIWILGHCKKELNKRYKEVKLIEQFDECIRFLFQNPRHPGLNLETVDTIGKYQILSSRITNACRVILVPITKTEIGLLYFDTDHDGAYNWVKRNRSRIGTMLDKEAEIIRGTPLSAYIGANPAIAHEEDSPLALASAEQFRAMLAEGLPRYLAHLDKEQQALVNLNVRSLLLVKGGAGTGKTAVAVHRLLALSRQTTLADTMPKDVLYLCYNRLLSKVAEQLVETLCNGIAPEWVRVNTSHTWCYEFLKDTVGIIPVLDERGCKQTVYQAMGKLSPEQKASLNKRDGSFVNDPLC